MHTSPRAHSRALTRIHAHTRARSPCGGRGHWLTDSFGISAKHEEAHSLLQPRAASSRRKVEHRPRILVSLCRSSRLSSLLRSTGDRASRLCNRARGISENPFALSSDRTIIRETIKLERCAHHRLKESREFFNKNKSSDNFSAQSQDFSLKIKLNYYFYSLNKILSN